MYNDFFLCPYLICHFIYFLYITSIKFIIILNKCIYTTKITINNKAKLLKTYIYLIIH
ncbi:hypothetical protein HanRHA438_Chr15g0724621 [Helianthus annuus]|nr:hypothetical protein HanRHA438_Chr15g0724621 [Helianthus annuus]